MKLIEWFEHRAAQGPDAVALVRGQDRLTYRELQERANRCAHLLRAAGVTAEVVVGVCGPADLNTSTLLLAILKAGGTYLPLDPTHPDERLRHMLHKAGTHLVVTHNDTQAQRLATLHPNVTTWQQLTTDLHHQPTTAPP
ncbi:AMP-binding protein, partial [Micromonospora orduensis]|uniref:AMP-binding protein n=1 Tax=Micromonospora orduensis TaxID=1420891 RepID=UPI00142ED91C